MQRPLDPLSFKKNVYERPNQEWICGHAADGRACPLGPDERGNCRHAGECSPAKKGDRWMCTRSEARGGKCEEGPLPNGACAHPVPPCQPVRSLRQARGIVAWLAVAVTAGALLILLGNHFRHVWMDPGPLTNAHITSATKCSDCHSLDPPEGAHPVFSSLGQRPRNDSVLCLKCHDLGKQPLHPHGLAPVALSQVRRDLHRSKESARAPGFLRLSHALATGAAPTDDLACAICHQEHHGRNFNLTRLTDAQCQACHSVQFASFGQGHPEFADYPYQRRTRIFFDHTSHLQQHFGDRKEKAPAGCQSCHVPGPAGRFMQVKNFDSACAGCHSAQIQGEGVTVKGVAFFTVPGVDADTLATKGISVGEWPKPKDADGKITPFMELLLSHQPLARAAIEKLRGVDLLDLTNAAPDQLAAADQLVWSVKTLLFNLIVEGQPYLMKEMKDAVAPAGLEVPRAALMAAQEEWMPHLLTDVANYQKGIRPPLPEKPKPPPPPPPSVPPPVPPKKKRLSGGHIASIPTHSPAKPPVTPESDLLTGGNDDLAAATPSPSAPPGKDDDLTSGTLPSTGPAASPPPPTAPSPASTAMTAEEWVAAGGWYRQQGNFTLYYRPAGHADPFLVAWLNAAARFQSENATAPAQDVFQKLTDREAPGLCMKCHSVENSNGVVIVNWRPAQPHTKSRPFTTFSHTTHFSLVGDAGCQTCHALNPKSEYARFFTAASTTDAARNPMTFQSNFSPISKMLCAECHQPRVAGDACVLCHRYHAAPVAGELTEVGRFHTSLDKKSVFAWESTEPKKTSLRVAPFENR